MLRATTDSLAMFAMLFVVPSRLAQCSGNNDLLSLQSAFFRPLSQALLCVLRLPSSLGKRSFPKTLSDFSMDHPKVATAVLCTVPIVAIDISEVFLWVS